MADLASTTDQPTVQSALRHSLPGIAILCGVFAINVYRAIHQCITADEAMTYDWYIVNPWNWILVAYNANNHVLHTILCRLSVEALGQSELTMRLPSLLGGLLYLVFVYKLCRYLFKHQAIFLLGVVALTLNPFIMDYLSAARGYGMALGFFTAALYYVIRFFDDQPPLHHANGATLAAILLGFAIAANLVFLFPAVAVAGTITLLRILDRHTPGIWKGLWWSIGRVWLPLALPAVLFVSIPLAHANGDAFYYGEATLRSTVLSLVPRSLFHHYGVWTPGVTGELVVRSTQVITNWVVPAVMAVLVVTLSPLGWRWLRALDLQTLNPLDRAYFLIGSVLASSLGMLVAARYLRGLLYPVDRTAIYLVMLLTLAWILLIERAWAAPHLSRTMGMLATAPLVIVIVLFLAGFTTSYYYEWRYDAGTRRVFHLLEGLNQFNLEGLNQFNANHRMKLGVDWKSTFTFDFYRRMYHADWLMKVTRDRAIADGGFDYYVLLPEDENVIKKLALRVIYRDPVSGQELAIPDSRPVLSSKRHI